MKKIIKNKERLYGQFSNRQFCGFNTSCDL